MSIANIVHSGYGFRCTATDRALPLTLGLDGSAVLERLAGPAWQVVEDPVNRLVSFEVRRSYQATVEPGGALERISHRAPPAVPLAGGAR